MQSLMLPNIFCFELAMWKDINARYIKVNSVSSDIFVILESICKEMIVGLSLCFGKSSQDHPEAEINCNLLCYYMINIFVEHFFVGIHLPYLLSCIAG